MLEKDAVRFNFIGNMLDRLDAVIHILDRLDAVRLNSELYR